MSVRSFSVILGFAVLPLLAVTPPAAAQPLGPVAQPVAPSYALAPSRARNRIEIHPRPLLYRRCVDWYELQHRPSGTVLYPQMRCWWVRG